MKVKTLAIGVAVALAVAVPAFGGGPAIFAKALAVGTMKATTIQTKGGAMVLDSITIPPAATSAGTRTERRSRSSSRTAR